MFKSKINKKNKIIVAAMFVGAFLSFFAKNFPESKIVWPRV